ncbi:MAG: hypothetical protein IPI01_18435 [Ignavibacteriae bacterium]|nr:hypothetical protein [Ignavibacteriota bacterium]
MRIRSLYSAVAVLSLLLLSSPALFAQVDHFAVTAAGGGAIGTQNAGDAFAIRITAQKADNSTEASFTGKVFISSTGTLTAGGDSTVAFVNGVLSSHSVTIGNTGNFTITAAHPLGSGTSASFPVIATVSDDFNRPNLDTSRWTFTDPVGDATLTMVGSGTANARLSLAIPANVQHDLWTGINNAPRVMQSAKNSDFVLQTKFDSGVLSAYQIQGVLVQQDANTLIRFDLSSSGTNTYIYAASSTDGFATVPTTRLESTLAAAGGPAPIYLRITRAGNTWTVATSTDGSSFTSYTSFDVTLAVSQVGLFAGNAGAPAPAFTMLVDYFFDNALPVASEDGGSVSDAIAPFVYNISSLAGGSAIRLSWKTDEPSTSKVEYGTTVSYGSSVVDDTLRTVHVVQINGLSNSTPYHARIIATDVSANVFTSADLMDTTTVPTPPTLSIWQGTNQTFGTIGVPQRWANILGNISDPYGIDTLVYRLNNGSPVTLTRGPDLRRLQNTGDFNVDLGFTDLAAGANTLAIHARNVFGDAADTTVTVNDNAGAVWPLPYSVSWGSPTSLKDSVQVVDGKWELVDGKARATERGYDRCFAIGDTTWQDYEATMKLTVRGLDSTSKGFDSPSNGPAVGFLMRWKGHSTNPIAGQPLAGYLPLGAVGWVHWTSTSSSRWELLGNNLSEEGLSSPSGVEFDTTYYFKMQVRTIAGQGGYYRFKVWKASESEPAAWKLSAQEGLSDPQNGSLLILAHHVTVDIAEVRVTAIPTDLIGPIVSGVTSETGATSAYITWTTDEPANGRVAYGLTSSYTDTAQVSGTLSLAHGVPITGLNPSTTYHFQVLSSDVSNNLGTSSDGTFTTGAPAAPTTLASDEFNSTSLNGMWTFTNPVADVVYTTPDTALHIPLPSGTEHDLWTGGNNTARMTQSVNNTDFEAEVKFNSGISGTSTQYRIQGILVEQDANDLIRFDFTSKPTDIRAYAAVFRNGFVFDSIGVKLDSTLAGAAGVAPIWLRVKREGNVWSQWYSTNGTTWHLVVRFHHAMTVARVGVFAGNAGSAPPAHDVIVDYFRADGVRVNLRAFLQGPYVAAAGETMPALLGASIPQKNPYGVSPWNYAGNDSLVIPSGVVDWVLVTLRSGTAAATGVDTAAGFIKENGSIVGLDGSTPLQFPGVKFGNYYIVLQHRNHLSIMSANAVALNNDTSRYDFTTSQSKAYGSSAMKGLGTGGSAPFGMLAGDANGSGDITILDRALWRVQNSALGYYSADFNLSGDVTILDRALWRINNSLISQVP